MGKEGANIYGQFFLGINTYVIQYGPISTIGPR